MSKKKIRYPIINLFNSKVAPAESAKREPKRKRRNPPNTNCNRPKINIRKNLFIITAIVVKLNNYIYYYILKTYIIYNKI